MTRRFDWHDTHVAQAGFSAVTCDRLLDAGFTRMRQLAELTDQQRRETIPGLGDGQFDRITSILAEHHDNEVVRRCYPFGTAE